MNEQEKSLEHARIMGWRIYQKSFGDIYTRVKVYDYGVSLRPYADDEEGLAQFAAILLKYLQDDDMPPLLMFDPTQENILNEILVNNDVEI
ncbi:MAG: hypothetical protein R8M45_05030 [Ghiorsea sp.]